MWIRSVSKSGNYSSAAYHYACVYRRAYDAASHCYYKLAIEPSLRSKGCGGRATETIKTLYGDYRQTVDFEILDQAAENNEQRRKRRSFYLCNGYGPTGYGLSYRDVTYEVMCSDLGFEIEGFRELMSKIPLDGLDPRYFRIKEQNK